MPERKTRKVHKLRGHRSRGRGNVKNRRGSGNRGGRGNAVLHKHKWTYTVKYDKDHFGSSGFVRHVNQKRPKTINVWGINTLISNGKIEKKGGIYSYEFNGKILGSGEINFPVHVKAKAFTEKAAKKIESAGGKAEHPSQ
jgi:large subunit ribosomal protein L15